MPTLSRSQTIVEHSGPKHENLKVSQSEVFIIPNSGETSVGTRSRQYRYPSSFWSFQGIPFWSTNRDNNVAHNYGGGNLGGSGLVWEGGAAHKIILKMRTLIVLNILLGNRLKIHQMFDSEERDWRGGGWGGGACLAIGASLWMYPPVRLIITIVHLRQGRTEASPVAVRAAEWRGAASKSG